MNAYWAVIRDSFREALASRVLWIVLMLITAVLLAIAPLGIRRTPHYRLRTGDVRDWRDLAARLQQQGTDSDVSPGRHIWSLLDAGTQSKLEQLAAGDSQTPRNRLAGEVTESLNALLERRDFFAPAAWDNVALPDQLPPRAEQEMGELPAPEMARRNRLLLEAAYPDLLREAPPTSLQITFLSWEIGADLPFRQQQVERTIEVTLSGFVNLFVGAVGVLVAILVTASVIPQMFHAGSIDLLLSKPISRSLLFLAKFVGGCAFILVSASYLIVGLWLVVGWRLGVWNHRMLLCIPIFLFLFLVYYSVSALAGLVYRNTVLAIVMTILFWLVCFSVGVTKAVLETFFIQPNRLIKVVPAGESYLAVRETGKLVEWDEDGQVWREVFHPPTPAGPVESLALGVAPRLLGPVYDAAGDDIYAVELRRSPFASSNASTPLLYGRRSADWARHAGPILPPGTVALLMPPDGKLTVVSRRGLYRLAGDSFDPAQSPPVPEEAFTPAGPLLPILVQRPAAVGMDPDSDRIALWTGGTLRVLRPKQRGQASFSVDDSTLGQDVPLKKRPDPFVCSAEKACAADDSAVLVGISGDVVLLARSDGRVQVLDAETLELRFEPPAQESSPPRFITAAPGGRWLAVLFHNDRLWIYDAAEQKYFPAPRTAQGDISAVAFSGPQQLLVVDRATRLSRHQLPDGKVQQRLSPQPKLLGSMYRYAILPLYTCFPKPGELDDTVDYLLSGQETFAAGGEADDLTASRVKLNPWQPVWSSALFVVVVLAAACVYVERQEF